MSESKGGVEGGHDFPMGCSDSAVAPPRQPAKLHADQMAEQHYFKCTLFSYVQISIQPFALSEIPTVDLYFPKQHAIRYQQSFSYFSSQRMQTGWQGKLVKPLLESCLRSLYVWDIGPRIVCRSTASLWS